MKKIKVLFSTYNLDIGGIETALINLLNELIKKYDVTLVLEKKQGIFLNDLSKKINIIEYSPNQNKNVIIRKVVNLFKRIKFILRYKNKFNFSASFATYSKMGSFVARCASKNNALWIHTNYVQLYKGNINEINKFFEFIKYYKFKRIIFVSKIAKEETEKIINIENSQVINNLIDIDNIINKSKENISEKKTQKTTFLNICRHEEEKRLDRIIEAANILKQDKNDFLIYFIGEGSKTNEYKNMVKKYGLDNNIIFLGIKKNPYPYFKICDCLLVSSDYEGYPVVYNEAKILNVPIITTNVSDSKIDIENKFGFVVKKNEKDFYYAMKKIVNKEYKLNNNFNAENYNNNIIKKIGELICG